MCTAMVVLVYLLIQANTSVDGKFTALTKSHQEEDAMSTHLRSLNEGEDVTHRDYLVKALIDETIKNYKHEYTVAIENMGKRITKLKEQFEESSLKTNGGSDLYIRWGSNSCPNGTDMIYSGYAAGSNQVHFGGSAAPICLHPEPVMAQHKTTAWYTYIYGSEYHIRSSDKVNDVPCTVCRTKRRSTALMTPGTNTCADGWKKEYDGYLMAGWHGSKGNTDFVCMDTKLDTVKGGHADKDGQLFFHVTPICGSLPCPPYKEGLQFLLLCTVCSK